MIHHTAGYYANGSRKTNGVESSGLAEHIKYNLDMRPGRAFFVDGKCHNQGYLTQERCDEIELELKGVTAEKDTAPYR
jgi:hypothetical protein